MRRLLLIGAAVAAFGSAVSAQTLICSAIGTEKGLYRINWPSTAVSTVRAGVDASSVRTWLFNNGTNIMTGVAPERLLFNVAGSGTFSTSRTYSSSWGTCQDFEAGQGYDLYGGFSTGIFAEIWPSSVVRTTISGGINAMTRDGNTGDFICGTFAGNLVRVNSETYRQTTISTSLAGLTGLEYIPWTGYLLASRGNNGANIVTTGGSNVRTLSSSGFANTACVDQVGMRLFIGYNDGRITEYTSTGTAVLTRDYGNILWSGIDVYRDKEVTFDAGTGARGTNVLVRLNFPSSANRSYACAISLLQRPVLQFGTHNTLNMAPDTLFLLTVGGRLPVFTSGFAGTLSSSGQATANFGIPALLSASSEIYVGAVAINPSFPNNLDVGNVEVINVR
jgi:hypothetical protein